MPTFRVQKNELAPACEALPKDIPTKSCSPSQWCWFLAKAAAYADQHLPPDPPMPIADPNDAPAASKQLQVRPFCFKSARLLAIAPQAQDVAALPGREMLPTAPFELMAIWGKLKKTYRSLPVACKARSAGLASGLRGATAEHIYGA